MPIFHCDLGGAFADAFRDRWKDDPVGCTAFGVKLRLKRAVSAFGSLTRLQAEGQPECSLETCGSCKGDDPVILLTLWLSSSLVPLFFSSPPCRFLGLHGLKKEELEGFGR